MRTSFWLSIPVISILAIGCSPDRACTPGASIACVGAGGCSGGQTCNAEGTGYGACDCGEPVLDAGPREDAQVADARVEDAPMTDADGTDASDGGPVACDPVTHASCEPDERCAWVQIAEGIGALRCVPDGTVAEGDPCTVGATGETTGYDDCARGLACAGVCRTVCDLASPSATCGTDRHCTRYAGLFASGEDDPTHGLCNDTCDPLTQRLPSGAECPTGQGCYALFTSSTGALFVCAGVGTVGVGETIPGSPFANSCVPGATPTTRPDGTITCAPFCRPVETHSGAPAGAGGESPYSCGELGASGQECQFAWTRTISDTYDPRLNELGVCFDRTDRLYDADGDGVPETPYPSCTTLSDTDTDGDGIPDHRRFGCAPLPAP